MVVTVPSTNEALGSIPSAGVGGQGVSIFKRVDNCRTNILDIVLVKNPELQSKGEDENRRQGVRCQGRRKRKVYP